MSKRSIFLGIILCILVLSGCSSSVDQEFSNYIEDIVLGSEEEYRDELEDIEQEYIQAIESGQTEEVFTILEDEYIPKVEEAIDTFSSYELEQEEIIDLNELLMEEFTNTKERLNEQSKAFKKMTVMESDDDLKEVIELLDNVVKRSEEYVDARNHYTEKLAEMVDEYDPDVTMEETVADQQIQREDVSDAVYNEMGWFVQGLGYSPDMLVSEELEEVAGVNTENELQVELIGEVQVDDGYVVHGISNLPEDAELEAAVYFHGEEVSKDHTTYTNDDGSFEIDIPDLDIQDGGIELQVRFRPADQVEDLQDIYGEVGENMEGDYIYLYPSIKRKYSEAMMVAHFNANEADEVSFEKPEWDVPADYGELDIWMEVEDLEEHEAYYDVHVRSNFAEGTQIRGDIEVPGYDSAGFLESTLVQPDGSFNIQLQKPDVKEDDDVHIVLEMLPNSLLFAYTEELYGEKGEYIEGDLVEEHKEGQKIRFEYSVQKEEQVKED